MRDDLRILLIDDNQKQHQFLSNILEKNGFKVNRAANSEQGLGLLSEKMPTMVFVNFSLSEGSGIELCREIKTNPSFKHVLVVLLAAEEMSADEQQNGLRAGADGILLQPFSEPEFVSRIKALLRYHGSSDSVAEGYRDDYEQYEVSDHKISLQAFDRKSALAQIELAINQPHELQTVLDQIVDLTNRYLPSSGAFVALWDKNRKNFWVSSFKFLALIDLELGELRGGSARWIVDHQEPVIIPNIATDSFERYEWWEPFNIKAYLGVPLVIQGEPLGVLFALDIHLRSYSEDEIEFLKTLASRAALAIWKVRQFQNLQEAKQMAEETARKKTEFLANMSHEFRTPMSAVLGMADLLEETDLDPVQVDYVDTIRTSANKILDLINDILEFSRIEADKLYLKHQAFDLRSCIEMSLELVARSASEKGINLSYNMDMEIPNTFIGDSTRLGQILVNLLSNAVKFTEEGEILLSISGHQLPQVFRSNMDNETPRYELLFEVQDTGIGIDPSRIEKLFRAFSQLDVSRTRQYGGTGLGLSISKQLVEMMGGTIWVDSTGVPGEGTSFHFTIMAEAVPDSFPTYLDKDQPPLKGRRVLVLSGFKSNRIILKDQLEYWGMQVQPVEGLEEGISLLQSVEEPDLVLLGDEFTRSEVLKFIQAIRQPHYDKSIPIILLTDTLKRRQLDLDLYVSGYLNKPIRPVHLYNALLNTFQRGATRSQIEGGEEGDSLEEHGQGLRILVAEDNPTNQKVISLYLHKLGYSLVDIVSNGLEVVQAIEERRYNVVLMDLQMPEMNGISATRYIREAFPKKQQPFIIALTAESRPEIQEQLLSSGVDLYLSKPVQRRSLVQALEKVKKDSRHEDSMTDSITTVRQSGDSKNGVIDETVLGDFLSVMGEDADIALGELTDSFFTNAPHLLEEMNQATKEGAWDKLKWAAHAFKGNCELLGAIRLSQMCIDVENAISKGDFDNMDARITQIGQEYLLVKKVLQERYVEI